MEKGIKAVFALFVGAIVGTVGLSLLIYLLFWGLNPKQMSNSMGYSMLMFLFTVPVGGLIGGIVGFAWFFGCKMEMKTGYI